MAYLKGVYLFQLMKAVKSNEFDYFAKVFIQMEGCQLVMVGLRWYSGRIQRTMVSDHLQSNRSAFFLNYLNSTSPLWLRTKGSEMNEVITTISNGVIALDNVLITYIQIFTTIFQSFSSVIVLCQFVGVDGLYSFISISSILILGIRMLRIDYKKQSEINRTTKPINTEIHNQGEKFFINRINGMLNAVSRITQLKNRIAKMWSDQNMWVEKMYYILDGLQVVMVGLTTLWLAYKSDNLLMIYPAYQKLYRATNDMWRLFHLTQKSVRKSADWAPMEDLLVEINENISPDHYKTVLKSLEQWIPTSDDPTMETRLIGQSGSGKTTFMMKTLAEMYDQHLVNWVYMNQDGNIKDSKDLPIYQYMIKKLTETQKRNLSRREIEKELLQLSQSVGMEKIINLRTLDALFEEPSKGERIRIRMLQNILPFLLEHGSELRFFFADEITDGLDDTTREQVENILRYLRQERGVTIVRVEHHTNYTCEACSYTDTPDDIFPLYVHSEPVIQPEEDTTPETPKWKWYHWIIGPPTPPRKKKKKSFPPKVWVTSSPV